MRFPSCEGRLPLRSLLKRPLREGRRSGRSCGNGDGRRWRQVRRARFPYAPPASAPSPAPYPATALRRECRGAVAHRYSSSVSSPNCEGTLPLRSLPQRRLREGRRSGIMGEDGRKGRQVRRVLPLPAAIPSAPQVLCHGLEAGVPSCGGSQARQVGEQPNLRGHAAGQALVEKVPARGAPEREEGSRGVPVGASDLRRAADALCASPLRDATTLRHHPTRGPPSVPSRRRSSTPLVGWCMVHGGRCNGAHILVPL